MKTKALLTAIAVIELMTGVGLLLAPSLGAELLLGAPLSPVVPLVVGRVAGLALVAIGLTCWLETVGDRGGSPNALHWDCCRITLQYHCCWSTAMR